MAIRPCHVPPARRFENTFPKIAQAMLLVPDLVSSTRPARAAAGSAGAAGSPLTGRPGAPRVTAVQELLLDRFPIVAQIYAHMGWDVVDERQRPVRAPRMVYSCVAPPLHPYLWQLGQALVLGVQPLPLQRRTKLVYCGRTKTGRVENEGRRVLNEDEVVATLSAVAAAHGLTVDQFDHTKYTTIQSLMDYFSTARGLIGPHGGCLTNTVFLGCNSLVVELFPLVNGVKPPIGHPGACADYICACCSAGSALRRVTAGWNVGM